jgi:hypothetical protein
MNKVVDLGTKKCVPLAVNIGVAGTCCNTVPICNACSPRQLVKNGGFELPHPNVNEFVYWNTMQNDNITISTTSFAYEGLAAALFQVGDLDTINKPRIAVLSQSVIVNPGCYLSLRFAEKLFHIGAFHRIDYEAKVNFFNGNNFTDLILISGFYTSLTQDGYKYHNSISDEPVPNGVNVVNVEIMVRFVTTVPNNELSTWLLDSVSLRAV